MLPQYRVFTQVLRSSIREFLCSEAMHHLGVPTTRAGTLVTSDTKVVRDVFYTGNAIMERATVITRIAPTFIRYGGVGGRDHAPTVWLAAR